MWNIRLRTRFLINLWFFLSSITWSQAIFHLNALAQCSMDECHWWGYWWLLMTKPQLLMELTTLYTIFDQNEWDYLLTEPKTLNLLAGNELDVQVCTEPSALGLRTRSSLFIIVRPGSNRQRVFKHLNGLVVSRLHGVNFNLGVPILTSIILPLV